MHPPFSRQELDLTPQDIGIRGGTAHPQDIGGEHRPEYFEGVDLVIPSPGAAKALIEPKCQELLQVLQAWFVYETYHDDDLETFVAKELIASGKTLALAESITGGSIAASLVKTPGMSNALLEGCVVYTNAAKQRLGVSEKLLQDYTAVSAEVAKALAGCVRLKAGSDIGLAVTGYAGPNDGDKTGLVYIAVSTAKSLSVREYHLSGQRDRIISRAVFHALRLLLETL